MTRQQNPQKKRRYKPGAVVPHTGRYRNTRTGEIIKRNQGERFSSKPRRSYWTPITRAESALQGIYDLLEKHSSVLEAVVAIATIIATIIGTVVELIRRSFVVAIILGLVAFVCAFALVVRTSTRSGTQITTRRRVAVALGALLLVALGVFATMWGLQKWQYPLFSPATEDQILVIVAEFEDRSAQRDMEIHRLIIDQISSDLAETQIENVQLRKSPTIEGDDAIESARKIGKKYNAAIVIWGWYDDAGFWPNFTITRPTKSPYVDLDVQSSSEVIAPGTPVGITATFSITGGETLALRGLEMPGEPISPDTFGFYIVEKMPAQMSYLSLFTIAQVYYWEEQFDQALDLLDIAIQRAQEGEINTQGGEIRNGLALAWFYKGFIHQSVLGNEQEALRAYNQTIDLNPDLDYPYNNRGLIYARQEQYELALADHNEALRISPEDPYYHAIRGSTYLGLRDHRNAISDFDYALAEFLHPALYYSRGNAHKYLGEYEQAIDDLTQAVALYPEFAWAYNSRGDAYAEIKEYSLAFEDFARSEQLEPYWALPYCNAGDALLQQGKHQEALAEYDRAVMLAEQYEQPNLSCSSSDFYMYLKQAEISEQMGNYTRAQADFDAIVRLFDELPAAYIERGRFFYDQREYEKALENFNRAVELTPESADGYHALGMVHRELREYDLALDDFSKAIEVSPDAPESRIMRAMVYSDIGDNQTALQDLEQALELNPESWEAYATRGSVYINSQEYQEALVNFEKAIELNPESARLHMECGKIYVLLGEYEQAIASFTRTLEIDPGFTYAYYERGRVYEEINNIDDATTDFEKFRDLTDDGYWQNWVDQKISELKARRGQ